MESDRQKTSDELDQKPKTKNTIGDIVGITLVVLVLITMIFIPGMLVGMWYGESLRGYGWSWCAGLFVGFTLASWMLIKDAKDAKDWKGLYAKSQENYDKLKGLYDEKDTHEKSSVFKRASAIIDKWEQQQKDQNDEIEDFILEFFGEYSGITNIEVRLNNDNGPPFIKIGDDDVMVDVDVSTDDGKIKDFATRLEKAHLEFRAQQD